MTYIYYYYSKFYSKYPKERRKETSKKAINFFTPLFKEDVDCSELFDYVLDILFTSVLKVNRGEISEDIAKDKVFKLIYMVIRLSLRDE